jgi:hypothetical protein
VQVVAATQYATSENMRTARLRKHLFRLASHVITNNISFPFCNLRSLHNGPLFFLEYPAIKRSPHRGSFDSFLLAGKCRTTVVLSLWKWRHFGIDAGWESGFGGFVS